VGMISRSKNAEIHYRSPTPHSNIGYIFGNYGVSSQGLSSPGFRPRGIYPEGIHRRGIHHTGNSSHGAFTPLGFHP